MFLSQDVKISRVMNAVAAGTSDQNGSSVDMSGWDGVIFIASFGTLTATQVTYLKGQGSADDSSFSDLASTNVGPLADGDSNKQLALDIYKPQHRYVRPVVDRGTANAVIDGITAIQYRGRSLPPTQPSTLSAIERHLSPAAGTA